MNPWLLIAGLCTTLAAFGGGYLKGKSDEKANHTEQALLIAQAAEAAQMAAASEIAKLKVKHTTITRKVEREIQTVPAYADCRHSAGGLRLTNQAITGTVSPDADKLPGKADGAK